MDNEFAKLSSTVKTLVEDYRDVMKFCGIPKTGWHSKTIERKAKPFLQGYFTLAVVGKVSSGKSTFINALLGCKDLLPTGHDQTTSGITYIEYGDTPEATIEFGDHHKQIIKGDDIVGQVKKYVSIPDEYHELPINNIDDMILGGFDFAKIWAARKQLEEETNTRIQEKLLKAYVQERGKKDIAVKVEIKYPFNDELKGWRVIDTPGIGAIGGIEEKTKQLLAEEQEDGSRKVDAIIFLQDGEQTLDYTEDRAFVNRQLESFTISDRERLFFVLTHSADDKFKSHKDEKLNTITSNYGDKIHLVTYADSLLYLFLSEFGNDVDLEYISKEPKPVSWTREEWRAIKLIIDDARYDLEDKGESVNQETLLRRLNEIAHFDDLKKEINQFAREEKTKVFHDLVLLIAGDYDGIVCQLNDDKDKVNGKFSSIEKALAENASARTKLNQIIQDVDEKIRMDSINKKFDFIEDCFESIERLSSEVLIRTAITNLFDEVQKIERSIFDDLKEQFKGMSDSFQGSSSYVFSQIDYDYLERQAEQYSKEKYIIEPGRTITHTCDPDERIPAKYGTRINKEQKLRNFKALALKRARAQKDLFKTQLEEKVTNFRKEITDDLDSKLKDQKAHYQSLIEQRDHTEAFNKDTDEKIECSHRAAKKLLKTADEYGFKYQ